ncbi:histidinol-phosphate transaminase [Aquimarina gracilis]|uniref:Histidinol-phosphate transaminase n=1 Tax=Aquimarina gracilis TaxID=874422 RepID=A0ABU5ZT50_9FLAO|nr:histidinol-phosphate transaminase [Aquimarina gracilis]MEB3345254.1 histidinol-phosphate transaminase [Aquimarina gracilis]
MNRRVWLKSTLISGSIASLGGVGLANALTLEEVKKFNPRPLSGLIRLSSNENPYGPSKRVQKAITTAFDHGCRYPYAYADELAEILAKKEGVTREHIIICGGSTEGLKVTGLTFASGGGEIIAAKPTFLAMMTYAKQWGASINWVPVDNNKGYDVDEIEKRISSKTKLVFLCNPNNPTSTILPSKKLTDFCDTVSNKTILFSDEAYYDFIEEPNYPSMVEFVKQEKNVIVSRTFSKVYGMAGLRIGYLIAKPELTQKLRRNMVAYSNVLAIAGAKEALLDKEFYAFSLQKNREAKALIYKTLDQFELPYVKSSTNFIFFKSGKDIRTLHKEMMNKGVLIGRPFPPFFDWCRISTGTLEEVSMFTKALSSIYG